MGKKRKRPVKNGGATDQLPRKQRDCKAASEHLGKSSDERAHHSHPVISSYYPKVLTLREYLLEQLPVSSKSRRRRIGSLGLGLDIQQGGAGPDANADGQSRDEDPQVIQTIAHLLDSTLIGILKEPGPTVDQTRLREFVAFTQSQERSFVDATDTGPTCAQSEVNLDIILFLYRSRCLRSSLCCPQR